VPLLPLNPTHQGSGGKKKNLGKKKATVGEKERKEKVRGEGEHIVAIIFFQSGTSMPAAIRGEKKKAEKGTKGGKKEKEKGTVGRIVR